MIKFLRLIGFVLFAFVSNAYGQLNYNSIKINELILPNEDVSKVLYLNGDNQVKSSAVTFAELEHLSGVTSSIQNQLDLKAIDADVVHKSGDETITGIKYFSGRSVSVSTTDSFHPCPSMTDSEMLAIPTPQDGDCVHNTTLENWMTYNANELIWEEMGGGGGISEWITAKEYEIDDVVIESNRIYQALTDHTSGTFTTDLAANNWIRLNDEFTIASDNDEDDVTSLEFPHNQFTYVGDRRARIETGNRNRLDNPGFEHYVAVTGWSTETTGTATVILGVETTDPIEGKQSLTINCDGGASGGTCTVLQDVLTSHAMNGSVSIDVKSDSASGVQVFSRNNGVNDLSENVLNTDSQTVEIPIKLGTSSTGVAVVITVGASEVKNVVADESFVGVDNLVKNEKEIDVQYLVDTGTNNTFTLDTSTVDGDGLFSASGNTITALKKIHVTASLSATASTSAVAASVYAHVTIPGTTVTDRAVHPSSGGAVIAQSTASAILEIGETVSFSIANTSSTTSAHVVSVSAFSVEEFKTYTSPNDPNDVGWFVQSINPNAPKGFISTANKTIGSTGADYSGSDYYRIYEMIWNLPGISTTAGDPFVIATAKGSSAKSDWDAGKLITVDFYTNEVFVRTSGATAIAGSYQANDNKSHNHAMAYNISASNLYINALSSSHEGVGMRDNNPGYRRTYNGSIDPMQNTGGTEARPNSAPMYSYIRYQPNKVSAYFDQFDYVYVEARGNSGQSTTASVTDVPFIEIDDIYNLWDGNSFQVPSIGIYSIVGMIYVPGSGAARGVELYIDGIRSKRISDYEDLSGAVSFRYTGKFTKDQVVSVRIIGTAGAVGNDTAYHWINITRIPGQF